MTNRLQVTTPAPGSSQMVTAQVLLDERDITSLLRGVNLNIGIRDRDATLELRLMPISFDGFLQVQVDDETRWLLTQLGWTPPQEQSA